MNRFMGRVFWGLSRRNLLNWMPDKTYLKLAYSAVMNKKLDLKNPQTFNEKLQWLKLNDRKDEYTMMVDKYLVRDYIAEQIGEDYLIPLLGVWDDPNDVDFNTLPDRFVLKCNHNSGLGMCICKDKRTLDVEKVKQDLRKGLKQNYYLTGREWPYKNVKPRIIAEQYMEDPIVQDLRDYKFFCFNGKVKCFKIDFDRFSNHRANYYDLDMTQLSFGEEDFPPDYNRTFDKPQNFEQMVAVAELLAKDQPFLRVDFYNIGGKIYFGELTFFPASGFGSFVPAEWDETLGSWIDLSKVKK